jgi:hypothetical protein
MKAFGFFLLFVIMLIAMVAISISLFRGTIWASGVIFPYVVAFNGLVLAFTIFVLLPNAVFSSTPRFAGYGLIVASSVSGFTAWLWCLLLSYSTFGLVPMFLGLFMFGVGVVPLAIFGMLINGMWSSLGELLLWTICVAGSWLWGGHLLSKAEAAL